MDVLQLEESQQPGHNAGVINDVERSIKTTVPSDEGSLTSGTSSGSSDFFVPDSPNKNISDDDDEDYEPPKITVESLKKQTSKNAKKTPPKKNTVAPVAKKNNH